MAKAFDASTPWRDGADNRLSTRMDVHVLHCDLLLALAAVAVERVEQGRIGARKLVRLAQVLAARLECLLSEHRSPVALHGGIVCGQQLSRDHAFKLVSRPDTDQREKSSIVLLVTSLLVGMLEPKRVYCLISENIVPVIGSRSPEVFQRTLQVIGLVGEDSWD